MTKEDFEQLKSTVKQWLFHTGSLNPTDYANELKLKFIEPKEKQITDLEWQLQEVLKDNDNYQADNEKLEKENAELKEKYVKNITDCDICDTYCNSQLTKAKVFIRSLKSLIEDVCDINYLSKDNTRLLVEAEQFLNEVEK